MIETRRLKNVVIFTQTILRFVLPRKIINIYSDIARKYRNVGRKNWVWKNRVRKVKLKLDIDFLNKCKQLGVYPKLLIFILPNVSNKDAWSISKRLLGSTINKRNKEFQHLSKELSLSKNFLSTQLSTIDFYILAKSTTSHNKKSLQESLCNQQKKLFSLTRYWNLPILQLTKLLLISRNMNYPRKNLTYLKQVYTFQSTQIKFKNLKSSLLLKGSIFCF